MSVLEFIKNQMKLEAESILTAADKLDQKVESAVDLLFNCKGKVVTTGMGKSGIIARKISASLASTGTSSIYLHPGEGIHGDLGMLQRDDVVIAISQSGNTQELISIIPYIRFIEAPLIAITGNLQSILAQHASIVLDSSVKEGYEPFNLVPTCSTTVQLALGDALAVALLEKRNFKVHDFALFHPGGTIGKKLLLKVGDLMHTDEHNPIVSDHTPMNQVIMVMTSKGLGCTNVINEQGALSGIVTDGDLRRFLNHGFTDLSMKASEAMTPNPKRMTPDNLAVEALNLMEKFNITMLPVVDQNNHPVGLLHMHDLIKSGVVS